MRETREGGAPSRQAKCQLVVLEEELGMERGGRSGGEQGEARAHSFWEQRSCSEWGGSV